MTLNFPKKVRPTFFLCYFGWRMKISTPFGLGQITHVEPEKQMKLSELFQEAQFKDFEFILKIGGVYVDDQRVFEDRTLHPAALVRVHRNPKRHPVQNINWASRIVDNNEHFVIIDKPHGVPVHATVDNVRENVLFQISEALNCPLYVTHRLDVETTGALVLAKTKVSQNAFNFLLQNKQVTKKYKALTIHKPPTGLIRHYIQSGQFTPKLVSADPIEGWQICEMVIEKVKSVTLPNQQPGFESEIRLITGRTHQIRAQMTGLVGPLFGDNQYGDDENKDYPLGLRAFELKFRWPALQKEFHYTLT